MEISRTRKPNYFLIDEQRTLYKEKFDNGEYTPWEFLKCLSNRIGCKKFAQISIVSESEDPEELEADTNMGGSNYTYALVHGYLHGFLCHVDMQTFVVIAASK